MALKFVSETKCAICKKEFIFTIIGGQLVVSCKCGSYNLEFLLSLWRKIKESGVGFEIQSNIFRGVFSAYFLDRLFKNGFVEERREKGKLFERVFYKPTRKFKTYLYKLMSVCKVLKNFIERFKRIEEYVE